MNLTLEGVAMNVPKMNMCMCVCLIVCVSMCACVCMHACVHAAKRHEQVTASPGQVLARPKKFCGCNDKKKWTYLFKKILQAKKKFVTVKKYGLTFLEKFYREINL